MNELSRDAAWAPLSLIQESMLLAKTRRRPKLIINNIRRAWDCVVSGLVIASPIVGPSVQP